MGIIPTLRLVWSFERRAMWRAFMDTWRFIESRLGAGSISILSILVGSTIYYRVSGAQEVKIEILIWAIYTLAGAGATVLLVFLWNLIAAPARLFADAQRQIAATHQRSTEQSQLIGLWRDMLDNLEQHHRKDPHLIVEPILRANPNYYTLEQYIGYDVRDAIEDASANPKVIRTMMLAGQETAERRAIRMLKQEIARLDQERQLGHQWTLTRLSEQDIVNRRQLVGDFYRMLDEVEQYVEDEKDVASRIRYRREYCRLEPYLDKTSRWAVEDAPVRGLARGDENDNEALLRHLRQGAADLERKWGLI